MKRSRADEFTSDTNFETAERAAIPVISEELVVDKREIATGGVRVEKHVDERTETIDMPLLREQVDIHRVVINQVVDKAPETRREGDVIIIPIVEEQLVVTKRLVLKEELHLTRRRSVEHASEQVTLRSERAEVTRVDAEGDEIAPQITERRTRPPQRTRPNRILKP